ncbi:MAG: M4 family metallopeptidase [Thermoanaerobaculum sp.]
MRKEHVLSLVATLTLGAGAAAAREGKLVVTLADEPQAVREATAVAVQFVQREAPRVVGLAPGEALALRTADHDGAGMVHVRLDHRVRGVRVVGGEVIVHVNAASRKIVGLSNFRRQVNVEDVTPRLGESDAVGLAWSLMAPAAAPAEAPEAELVLYPTNGSYRLAWVVKMFMENEVEEPRAEAFVIDAKTGEVIERWNDLHTAKPGGDPTPGSGSPAVGTAKTLYLGQLSLNTEFYSSANTYGMVDRTRGNAYTTDMKNRQAGSGSLFLDPDNTWGDFTNSDRATAGTDAHLGMAYTWDYFKNVHGRNGIYNDGAGAFSRVHYGRNYNNAFWSDSCRCMTYGDGDGSVLSPLVSLDVAGHEMSHGVTSATANLQYSGESGGLNEATSDIFGTAVEFYANNPNDPPDWWIGETVYTPNKAGDALRYMDDPKKDGRSIDHYSLYTNGLDVHYSSGIANNFFYLLAHGGTNRTSGLSVTGIGLAKAERIWYVALTGYMTSTTTFSQARQATIQAATQLFGASSVEVQRVKDAWTAVGVY